MVPDVRGNWIRHLGEPIRDDLPPARIKDRSLILSGMARESRVQQARWGGSRYISLKDCKGIHDGERESSAKVRCAWSGRRPLNVDVLWPQRWPNRHANLIGEELYAEPCNACEWEMNGRILEERNHRSGVLSVAAAHYHWAMAFP